MLKRGLGVMLAALCAATMLSVGTAQAATSGFLTAPNAGVLYDDCRDVLVPYSIAVDPGTDSWTMDVRAYGPDGTEEASDFVYDDADPLTGAAKLQFCGFEDPGTYTVRATGETSDYDANVIDRPFSLAAVTFTMRQPLSTTSVSRTYRHHLNLLSVAVSDERPNGYFSSKYANLRLQVFRSGAWRTLPRSSAIADSRGRYVYRVVRSAKVTLVRVMTAADSHYDSSVSRPVRLR